MIPTKSLNLGYYHPALIDRGRREVMRHMLAGGNRALCIGRAGQVVGSDSWNVVFWSEQPEDLNLFYRGGNQNFPLYLYPDTSRNDLFDALDEPSERRPNFHPQLLPVLGDAYGRPPSPEEVFHYVYAILYAHSYREKYADFLKIDYPRVPFTQDPELFYEYARLGSQLVDLHLLESSGAPCEAGVFLSVEVRPG